MEGVLEKVDFNKYSVYRIQLKIYESDGYNDGKENEVDEYGQSLDALSDLRRTVKYSYPCETKKIIKSILPQDQKEDTEGSLCRDIDIEYYLLVDKEDIEEFCIDELYDKIEEEWHAGSSGCDVEIDAYKAV